MKNKVVDCFMLMGTAFAIHGGQKMPEMGIMPSGDSGTVLVSLSFQVQHFDVIDAQNMDFEIVGVLSQQWVDSRLGANIQTRRKAVTGQIWRPKILNLNGLNRVCNTEDSMFWRGFGDEGNVLLSEKIHLQSKCTKDFLKFPFDKQFCVIKFGSYRYPVEELELEWVSQTKVIIDKFPGFDLIALENFIELEARLAGNFSVAIVQFEIQRIPFQILIPILLPCLLLSTINYYSTLWANNRKVITVSTLSLAILLLLHIFSVFILQPTNYLKAIDYFTIFSSTLSGLATVKSIFSHCSSNGNYSKVDMVCKLAYPTLYLIFIITFSLYCMN